MTENMTKNGFKNRTALLSWLQGEGYKIQKSKLYQDSGNGALLLEKDGTITGEAAKRYIAMAGLRKVQPMDSQAAGLAADRKLEEEIKQLELKNAKLEHELEVMRGKYVEKSVAESQQADLAALLDALPRHVLTLNLPRYLTAIGADPTRSRTFWGLFDEDFTRAVNQVCDDGEADIIGGDPGDLLPPAGGGER